MTLIRKMQSPDALSVASLHSTGIQTGFLSTLSLSFLKLLYRGISNAPESIVLVAVTDDNTIAGFISGTVSVKKMYRWIFKKYGVMMAIYLLPNIVFPKVLKKIIETLLYGLKHETKKTEKVQYEAELLSVSIKDDYRGKGIGRQLVNELEKFFYQMKISGYRVVTYSKDKKSNAFYSACGFSLQRQFEHHGNVLNEYSKEIESGR